MSKGRVLKDMNGPSQLSLSEQRDVMARLRTGQYDKLRDAVLVEYVAPDKLVFKYHDRPVEIGRLHRLVRR